MKALVLAFTLKEQSIPEILNALKTVREEHPDHILIHGFMPRAEVVKRDFSPLIVDTLEQHFPVQLNMYRDKPLREEMVEVAKRLDAKIVVIGEIKEGVKEEVDLYSAAGLTIEQVQLPSQK